MVDETELGAGEVGGYENNQRLLGDIIPQASVDPITLGGKSGESVNLWITSFTGCEWVGDDGVMVVRATNSVVAGLGNVEFKISFGEEPSEQREQVKYMWEGLVRMRGRLRAAKIDFDRAVESGEFEVGQANVQEALRKVDAVRSGAMVTREGRKVPLFSVTSDYSLWQGASYEYQTEGGKVRTVNGVAYVDLSLKDPVDSTRVGFETAEAVNLSLAAGGAIDMPPGLRMVIGAEDEKGGVPRRVNGSIEIRETEIPKFSDMLLDVGRSLPKEK